MLIALLALRREAQISLRTLHQRAVKSPTADMINTHNQKFFDNAAKLLGHELYERIFGEPPGIVELVDPRIHQTSMGTKR